MESDGKAGGYKEGCDSPREGPGAGVYYVVGVGLVGHYTFSCR